MRRFWRRCSCSCGPGSQGPGEGEILASEWNTGISHDFRSKPNASPVSFLKIAGGVGFLWACLGRPTKKKARVLTTPHLNLPIAPESMHNKPIQVMRTYASGLLSVRDGGI